MNKNHTLTALALAAIATCAQAQETPAPATPAETPKPAPQAAPRPAGKAETVTVNAARPGETSARQLSTASKLIFGREDLDRNGDATLGEVMRRLPSITSGGRPGRGGGINMRGMGGYTQILVNGEAPPPGFNVFSLPPDQVERVEIVRGPVAEFSTQAVAGTINIVLREDANVQAGQQQPQIRLGDTIEQGRHSLNAGFTLPGRSGDFVYMLNAQAMQGRNYDASHGHTTGRDLAGNLNLEQFFENENESRNRHLMLAPRLTWRSGADTVVLQPFVTQAKNRSHGASTLVQTVGLEPAPYAASLYDSESESTGGRIGLNWTRRGASSSKMELRASVGGNRSDSSSQRRLLDAAGKVQNLIETSSDASADQATVGGKHSRAVGDGHALAFGGEIETGSREQTTVSLDNGFEEFAESGDALSAHTRRIAAFIQDEWDINKQWSTNLGLRWEGIRTSSSTLGEYSNRSSVWSPVLHAVYRIPGKPKDQIRASVTRSYKAPGLGDLIAVPNLSRQNSPIYPDRYGNPGLKPELANGFEAAIEHFLPRGGILSANLFARDIDNLIRRQTAYEPGLDRWVNRPRNIGAARTYGLELEAKFQLREFWPDAPMVDLRSNYSLFRSRVDGLPEPDNRLDGQPSQTANLGFDWRLANAPLSFGASVNWTPAYDTRVSETSLASTGRKRQFDAYALWRISPKMQLRVSANNIGPDDYWSANAIRAGLVDQRSESWARTFTQWGIRLEIKL